MIENACRLSVGRARSTRIPSSAVLMTLLILLAGPGCQQDSGLASRSDPAGTYTLVTFDGRPVPCPVTHEGVTLTFTSGTMTLNADGTGVSRTAFTLPDGRAAGREVRASWTRAGNTLTLRWEGAGTTIATVEGDTFTMNNEGMVLVYRR